jgi:hypothetical protein
MPRKRPPREVWDVTLRPAIWKRDGGRCVRCEVEVKEQTNLRIFERCVVVVMSYGPIPGIEV